MKEQVVAQSCVADGVHPTTLCTKLQQSQKELLESFSM